MFKKIIKAYKVQRALYPELNVIQRYFKHRRLLKKRAKDDNGNKPVLKPSLQQAYYDLMHGEGETVIAHSYNKYDKETKSYVHINCTKTVKEGDEPMQSSSDKFV